MGAAPFPETLPPPPAGSRGWPWDPQTKPRAAGGGPWPRITVVTPSFNQARFVEATLRSVLLQGYPDLEYVVMDGGSSDGSAEVIRKYGPWLSRWASEPDRGQSHALNKGLSLATGRIVAWVNSDDRLMPGALFGVARAAARRPEAVAWVGAVRSVTPSGRLIYLQIPRGLTRDELADFGNAGQFAQPGCFFSREAAASAGPLREDLHYAFDVDFWLRLAALGPFAASEEIWAEETIHSAGKTASQRGKSLAELHLVQIRHGYEALAMRRMAEELQEYDTLKRGTLAERLKYQVNLALQPLLGLLGRR